MSTKSGKINQGLALVVSLCLSLALWALSGHRAHGQSIAAEKVCGPPVYCARTDRKVEPYGKTPPSIGPADSILADPVFGSRILRVTDEKSNSGAHPGASFVTPSSAEQNSWNTSATQFYVLAAGGRKALFDFDPKSMKAHETRIVNMPGEPEFSYKRDSILYGLTRTGLQEYDTSRGRSTEIDDASKCVQLEPSDTAHSISASADDNRLLTVLGPRQDDNYIVYIYDRTLGCRWYNTKTGQIGGKWGEKGNVTLPDRFTLHNARMSKSGKYIFMQRGGGQGPGRWWLIWDVATLNLAECRHECPGHHVMGYSHILGGTGKMHPLELWLRPLDNLETHTDLVKGLEHIPLPWYDSHFSWNNVDPNDSTPACFATYRGVNPDVPGAPLYVTGPWENEIDCVETDGKDSTVWRFAHTYSTAKNGFWSTPRGNVSQDGRFYMFTSDWQDQLGRTENGKYRSDVFIVELR